VEVSRQEHLDRCKRRALKYLAGGDTQGALTSMFSDLGKHEETRDHIGIKLGAMLMFSGNLETPGEVREFIEGFN
jgi:hypothetical protein